MPKKTKGKTGFRNGELFCFNCGGHQKFEYPIPVTEAAAIMKQFAKDHEDCPATWVEPQNTPTGKTEAENANWWAENGEHGTSSKTMFNRLIKGLQVRALRNDYECHPLDPDDFSRCYKLLQAVPQWKVKLYELKAISLVWERLVDNWDKLTEMYEQNEREQWKNYKKIGMYEFMESLGC